VAGQQVFHGAQHVRPVLAFMRALFCRKNGQLVAQVGDTPIKCGCARSCGAI